MQEITCLATHLQAKLCCPGPEELPAPVGVPGSRQVKSQDGVGLTESEEQVQFHAVTRRLPVFKDIMELGARMGPGIEQIKCHKVPLLT